MSEPIWNTRITIVDLVPASSPEEAIAKLTNRAERAGLNVHHDGDETQNAFESEFLGDEVEADVRRDWR